MQMKIFFLIEGQILEANMICSSLMIINIFL